MMKSFDCDDVINIDKYVWCKINRHDGFLVMLQSFSNDFAFLKRVPTEFKMPGKTLKKSTEEDIDPPEERIYFLNNVGKLVHIIRWSRPDIYNLMQYLTCQMSAVAKDHIYVMHRMMVYCVATPLQGWKLKPSINLVGKDKLFEIEIEGKSDSDYIICKATMRSMSGWRDYLEVAPISANSSMYKIVVLSVTESE